ncbi:FeoC-like transcriptional regulator [Thaumasiovibrio sp. DFM-14]|uniref:FeoC-like transcriptional regulator n=1 Tax=Thaumasiovibrio sp. DFM-14 TaxID=3384792 RepID=UPI0039A27280
MILRELRQYLEQNGRCERSHLAHRFALSHDGVDTMLEVWLRKGMVRRDIVGSELCQTATQVWYRWVEKNEIGLTQLR